MAGAQDVGRDELAAMLGASRASDLVASAGTTADDLAKSQLTKAGTAGKHAKGGEEDVAAMDRAQAAALVARKFAEGKGGAGMGGVRHRATGKRKRALQLELLAGDLMEQHTNAASAREAEEEVAQLYQKEDDEEEDEGFQMRPDRSGGRTKAEAVVLKKKGGERRRRRDSSSSDSESSESSASSSGSSRSYGRRERRGKGRRSRSNSSSSSEDEADARRRRAREQRAKREEQEKEAASTNGEKPEKEIDEAELHSKLNGDAMSVDEKGEKENQTETEPRPRKEAEVIRRKQPQTKCRARSDSSSSGSGSSSSSGSSLSSDSSSDESEDNAPMAVSKPLFVPKSKRGTVAEVDAQEKKMEEAGKRREKEAERRAIQSRALVAEVVSTAGKVAAAEDDGDEFDTGEAGGDFIAVPDDTDPTEEDSPEKVMAERDAWEVRELVRILRDVDEALQREKERKELERRRALSDRERLEEDKRTGRYRAPGEERRKRADEKESNNYLQRYHHRGAFYMDEDTLAAAGDDDVRHRAKEYSRAATGEDKIDKSALPEVMQVKKFGLAGYSTKYKGLAKEDTTDKGLNFLPIGQGRGRGRGKRDDRSGGDRDRYERGR